MKKRCSLLITSLILLFSACQNNKPDLGIAQNYYPPSSLLEKGIVNKYYNHQLPAGKKDISTDVQYRSYQFSPTRSLYLKSYNPAMKNTQSKELLFENNQTYLLKQEDYSYDDSYTFNSEILKPVVKNWASSEAHSEKIIHYNWISRKWVTKQLALRDTTILKKQAIIFEEQRSYTTYQDGDTIPGPNTFHVKSIYVKDLGLYYEEKSDIHGKSWMELVEQIPLKTFNDMANHGRKRVAFIKEADAIEKDTSFKLCNDSHSRISDYYVGDNLNSYKGGKRVIRNYIYEKIDRSKLFKESGYLTFRFFVNCKGQAGRYVTEETDLDFQRKEFNPKTVAHCYELLKGLKDWNPTVSQGNVLDAVFYFTFKLEDGELIEILPKF